MNKLKQIIAFLLIMTSFFSCSKEDNAKETPEKESINKKWIVGNSAEFKSIEFDTNGNYIITKNKIDVTSKVKEAEEIILLGTYEILDTDVFLLSDFGTLKYDDSDPNHIKFSVKYEGSDTYTYELNVTKSAEFTSTPKTDLLCNNTWKFTRKEPIKDTINLINFSKAGTCFTNFSNSSANVLNITQFGKWKWQDKEETKIVITQIKYPQWIIDKDEEVEFEITKLTSTRLEMSEVFNNETYTVAFDTIRVLKK
ncbi:hypothetical protein [Flavobacterium sp. 5]|uniref:hypothetical protein n=1 Tax=Flavobacterium sp. 5 TaxID=2035199 RepID=UPI000C2CDDBB|nr:hypothetical protein [Flavobacterium sp. 5]PKB17157.1 hypothetical protein CLU82_2338 [Flavobacterium sp. 5]